MRTMFYGSPLEWQALVDELCRPERAMNIIKRKRRLLSDGLAFDRANSATSPATRQNLHSALLMGVTEFEPVTSQIRITRHLESDRQ